MLPGSPPCHGSWDTKAGEFPGMGRTGEARGNGKQRKREEIRAGGAPARPALPSQLPCPCSPGPSPALSGPVLLTTSFQKVPPDTAVVYSLHASRPLDKEGPSEEEQKN